MVAGLAVIVAVALGSAAAGYVLWWAAHRSAFWNFAAAILLGLATVLAAVFIAYLMVRLRGPL